MEGRTRRARTGPSQQELDEAAAAFAEYEEHKQRAAAQKAAQAAQRAAGLQRKRAAQRVQSVLDADEGYFYEAPDAELEGSAGPSACPLHWRRVFLQTLIGVGAIAIPTFKCTPCGAEFDLPPALVNCHTQSPVAASTWYDSWVVRFHDQLKLKSMADHTFATVLEAVAAGAEACQAEPRRTLPVEPKTFGPAMRHARLQQQKAPGLHTLWTEV
ncbi:hypothetical protein C2E20_5193 [Micractinium conductrix]|uniref:Uncharacterized protein n=1 Tax=Micractinium conductrix TaxID=554055 RepID=A0A2P6VBK1_9CHLO|nr:hypothetical protein C2E20_5193 [Micractinium conductrix]|eukprot:PSC71463.1 hypothetical protein C2E20_5193 [Micractinium conductrix]